MPIELGIWRIDGGLAPLSSSRLPDESRLEDALAQDVGITGLDLMVIGRQVITDYGKRIDLLGINADGELYVLELKRDRTPREAVAQLLDYGSWVKGLTYDRIAALFSDYSAGGRIEEAFVERFGGSPPELLNETHHLVLVASELDPSSERIVAYLAERGIAINVVFFRYFQDEGREYIGRSWLIEPIEAKTLAVNAPAVRKGGGETWNGQDFYVAFGEGPHRTWEDWQKYGFVSGGQGRWYSRTLDQLFPDARVFACAPGKGYIGVGVVKGTAQPVRDFTVTVGDRRVPILEAPLSASRMEENAENLEKSEYAVPVEWIRTQPLDQAIWEKGMFANQNTVCKLRNKFTLDRLLSRFGLQE
jgi:hypothetical protein